ncbi:AraC-type DNA-binding domain-containing protein [Rubidibacter lacunae KORDI 51-2]|uniref:AraC-type DNA-binding domain-containing protein n=1 Tax=Rubidibacter lacunae KORDI 51-2 TaxID=582515 RepID=U5DNI7_9CHRO|nr:AraC family transcriptional regulator [Rubidibacter lacunae]ERN42437.1 AraC-type DNA-binding domain-containing protein [Rubidibacter lacunae KORDI 51-2]
MTMGISSACDTYTLTSTELNELLEQAQQQGEPIFRQMELGTQINLPKALGKGCDRIINLRGGLTLHLRHATLHQTIRVEQQHAADFPLTAKFYLSGSSKVLTQGVPGIRSECEEQADVHYLYYLPDLIEVEEWQAQEPIKIVMIYAETDYFQSFQWTDGTLPEPLQYLMQVQSQPVTDLRFHQTLGKVTTAMHQVLQQILHCPYQGMIEQLYLESKALELLALQFAHWQADGVVSEHKLSGEVLLRSEDLGRLHDAKEILIERSVEPPSLVELARQVGLNDRKLKQGFRKLFGTTVFGYLQDYRMQQAKQLLHDSDLSIASVATTVGYKNPEAFSTAFRRKFHISPKGYQLSQRN